MAKEAKRIVSTGFWEDPMIVNEFSPEDKYFMLYLLTNPHTTQLGIYKLVPRVAAFEMGYSVEAVLVLIERFERKYDIVKYSKETSEIAIKNFLKHSVVKGGKPVMDCLLKEETKVNDKSLFSYIFNNLINNNNLNITIKEYLDHIREEYIKENENERIVPRIVNESYHESSMQKSNPKSEAEELFERLWKMYPVKRGKGSVSLTTKQKLLKVGEKQLIRCIERYLAERDELQATGKFCPELVNGSTFFNSRYIDYLDENFIQEEPKPTEPEPEEPEETIDLENCSDEEYFDWKERYALRSQRV